VQGSFEDFFLLAVGSKKFGVVSLEFGRGKSIMKFLTDKSMNIHNELHITLLTLTELSPTMIDADRVIVGEDHRSLGLCADGHLNFLFLGFPSCPFFLTSPQRASRSFSNFLKTLEEACFLLSHKKKKRLEAF
jgi:hypothetical protein